MAAAAASISVLSDHFGDDSDIMWQWSGQVVMSLNEGTLGNEEDDIKMPVIPTSRQFTVVSSESREGGSCHKRQGGQLF